MITRTISLYKKAYGGLSPSTWWLALVMLINRSGTMVVPFMTMYLTQELKVSIGKAGLAMSIYGLGAVIGALLGGKITDRIGYYYVQVCTLAGGGIMFIVVGQMHSFNSICIATFFLSMINEAFRPANSVAVANYSNSENITRSYSLNRLAINLGWAVGGAIGGLLAGYNYELLFWVDGFTNIGAAVLLLILLKPVSKTKNKDAKHIPPPKRSAYSDHIYIMFIILTFFFAACFFQLFTTMPVFYKEDLSLSEFKIGMLMALNGLLITFFEMIIVFKLEGKRPYMQFIAMGTIFIGLSFFILNLPLQNALFVAALSMLLATVGEIVSMPFMNSWWLARTQLSNRGQYAALYTVAWSTAQATGPLFGGQLAQAHGFRNLWLIIGSIAIACAVCFLFLYTFDNRSQKKALLKTGPRRIM